jgi:hypothetical protein
MVQDVKLEVFDWHNRDPGKGYGEEIKMQSTEGGGASLPFEEGVSDLELRNVYQMFLAIGAPGCSFFEPHLPMALTPNQRQSMNNWYVCLIKNMNAVMRLFDHLFFLHPGARGTLFRPNTNVFSLLIMMKPRLRGCMKSVS